MSESKADTLLSIADASETKQTDGVHRISNIPQNSAILRGLVRLIFTTSGKKQKAAPGQRGLLACRLCPVSQPHPETLPHDPLSGNLCEALLFYAKVSGATLPIVRFVNIFAGTHDVMTRVRL